MTYDTSVLLTLQYSSRADYDENLREYCLCYEDETYISFCEENEEPIEKSEYLGLLVKVDSAAKSFDADAVAKHIFTEVIDHDTDILLFQCRTGITYAYSCVKAVEAYFRDGREINGCIISGSMIIPGLSGPRGVDESCIDTTVYEAVLEALMNEGERLSKSSGGEDE